MSVEDIREDLFNYSTVGIASVFEIVLDLMDVNDPIIVDTINKSLVLTSFRGYTDIVRLLLNIRDIKYQTDDARKHALLFLHNDIVELIDKYEENR